jgi:ArsR family transcriptional regulator, cadmium/lead-responsive transcriptional repressor
MPMIQAEAHPGSLRPAAALFRSLADPARLAIVRHLATGPARVVDLTRELGLAQSTVSGHLACLRDCGLAAARPQGRASVWSLTQPALPALLAAAEAVLEATGNAVALCPVMADSKRPADPPVWREGQPAVAPRQPRSTASV